MSWRELFPFESQFCELDSNRMHFVREGKGPPLLMVHGNPTWSFYWREMIQVFRSRFTCIAIDHLGMGLSDKPQDYPYCLQRHTQNLVDFIRQHKLTEIHLVVHDWGGAIGLGAAVQLPGLISKIVITNTGAFPPLYIPTRISICRIPVLGNWLLRGLNVFPRAANKMATTQKGGLPEAIAAGLNSPYDSWPNRVGIKNFVFDIPSNKDHKTWAVLAKLEKNLAILADKPIQLIWGMQDWCFRAECLEKFQQIFESARVKKIESAGHYVVEDATDEVAQTMEKFFNET